MSISICYQVHAKDPFGEWYLFSEESDLDEAEMISNLWGEGEGRVVGRHSPHWMQFNHKTKNWETQGD
jgi:hypothetical protein